MGGPPETNKRERLLRAREPAGVHDKVSQSCTSVLTVWVLWLVRFQGKACVDFQEDAWETHPVPRRFAGGEMYTSGSLAHVPGLAWSRKERGVLCDRNIIPGGSSQEGRDGDFWRPPRGG